MSEASPAWDEGIAAALMGALVIIGITRHDADDKFISQEQFFGRVVAVDPRDGIKFILEGSRAGEEYALPPQTSAFQKAEPGEYRLRSTGEFVSDPDFTTNWIINAPRSE